LYATDGLTIPPAGFDARLNLPQRGDDAAATAVENIDAAASATTVLASRTTYTIAIGLAMAVGA
jgi:hypothetical protein